MKERTGELLSFHSESQAGAWSGKRTKVSLFSEKEASFSLRLYIEAHNTLQSHLRSPWLTQAAFALFAFLSIFARSADSV
ncbi:MAG TPA: hypothetical protein VG848_13615 [Acetobacteraceae bacterium]|nr:hypothetical protein [Acetobacteraceae bacterium]